MEWTPELARMVMDEKQKLANEDRITELQNDIRFYIDLIKSCDKGKLEEWAIKKLNECCDELMELMP